MQVNIELDYMNLILVCHIETGVDSLTDFILIFREDITTDDLTLTCGYMQD